MTLDWQQVQEFAPELGVVLDVLLALTAASHVILNKSDTRGATAWVALIWLVPFVGSILYFFLGINRIERRAKYSGQLYGQYKNVPYRTRDHLFDFAKSVHGLLTSN